MVQDLKGHNTVSFCGSGFQRISQCSMFGSRQEVSACLCTNLKEKGLG